MHPKVFATVVLVSCLLAAPTFADEGAAAPALGQSGPSLRTFTLKDGAMFGGEIVELVPNDHVTLKLATGELKRIEWADLAAAPASTWSSVAAPEQASPEAVPLTLRSSDPRVALFRDTGTDWTLVCNVPCETSLEPTARYRIAGRGISAPAPFRVAPSTRPLVVDVKAGSKGARIGGWITFGVGVAGAMTGVLLTATAPNSYDVAMPSEGRGATMTVDPGQTQRGVGIAMLIVGGITAVVGLASVSQGSTSLEGDTGALRHEASIAPRFEWIPGGFRF